MIGTRNLVARMKKWWNIISRRNTSHKCKCKKTLTTEKTEKTEKNEKNFATENEAMDGESLARSEA